MTEALAESIRTALPQTQCTRCGYPDCAGYAAAVANGEADINRCPPGGAEGIARLSALTGKPQHALDAECGVESPRRLAFVDEDWCIGCTLCIEACPVDCIVGAPKSMHTVIESECTGCELCVPVCPVDCIVLTSSDAGDHTGWAAWSGARAERALERYESRRRRLERNARQTAARKLEQIEAKLGRLSDASGIDDPGVLSRKRELVEAALARARARHAGLAGS